MITKASLSVTTQRADGCTFGRAGGSSSCRGRSHAVAVLRAWLRRRCVLVWGRDGLLPPRIETGSAIVTNSDAFGCPHGHPERRPTPEGQPLFGCRSSWSPALHLGHERQLGRQIDSGTGSRDFPSGTYRP